MNTLRPRLYRLILNLHPAEFRNRFAREMALDFDDALHTGNLAHLWRDLLCSLVRQWSERLLSSVPHPTSAPTPSLLAGDGRIIRDQAFTPYELLRGLAGSATLLALCILGLGGTHRPMADLPIVYASSQQPADTQPRPELLLYHPPGPLPAYEVASIKLLDPGTAAGMVKLPPGASLSPLSIRRYIMDAYGAGYEAQGVGGPDWLNKDGYLIRGKVPEDIEAALQAMPFEQRNNQTRKMKQSLLADRFHLAAHFETRVLPVYELVPAKHGLKITAVPASTDPKPGAPPMRMRPGESLPRGYSRTTFNSDGLRVLNASAIQMSLLARILAPDAGDRPIVNHTGFTGYFDVPSLTWAPSGSTSTASNAPSLNGALEDTLGLKLIPARDPIEVLVIDHIDRPSPN